MWFLAAFFVGVGVTLAIISIAVQDAAHKAKQAVERQRLANRQPPPSPGPVRAVEATRVRVIYDDPD